MEFLEYNDFINEEVNLDEVRSLWALQVTPWLKTTTDRYFPGQTFDNVEMIGRNSDIISFTINNTDFDISLVGNFKPDTIQISSEGMKVNKKAFPATLNDTVKVIDTIVKKLMKKYKKIN